MQRAFAVSWHFCLSRLLITWSAQDVRIVCSVESCVRALNIEALKAPAGIALQSGHSSTISVQDQIGLIVTYHVSNFQ